MPEAGGGAPRGARLDVRFNDEWWRRDLIGSANGQVARREEDVMRDTASRAGRRWPRRGR